MLLMIDNYDSFTWNVVQYLGELKADVKVIRNDELTVDEIIALAPERIVISPGPCTPTEAGVSLEVITRLAGKLPILGVCLGHQSIGQAMGGKVVRARQVMHGKVSAIHHNGKGVFANLPSPVQCHTLPLADHRESIAAGLSGDHRVDTAWTTAAWTRSWACGT
jgi:anthranilate synthase component 2